VKPSAAAELKLGFVVEATISGPTGPSSQTPMRADTRQCVNGDHARRDHPAFHLPRRPPRPWRLLCVHVVRMHEERALSGKVRFLTGCSRGFGRAWAEPALEPGDKVAATARDDTKLKSLAEAYPDRRWCCPST
jgi:hypothetical protein